jgi:hypothetical protein
MTTTNEAELDEWIAENIFDARRGDSAKGQHAWIFKDGVKHRGSVPQYSTDRDAAMQVLEKCYEKDRNFCFASFHNFLMRPGHDTSFTPLQICLFAKKLWGAE